MKISLEINLEIDEGLWLSWIEQVPPETSGMVRETSLMNVVKFKEA
ncbi:MAG: hypothetical protein ACRC1Z_22275 [Waterburya sp.]